jgi:DNA polymerase III alpha subunit
MEIMRALSLNTRLTDRTLWYDGTSTIKSSDVSSFVARGISMEHIFVDILTEEILQYNTLVKSTEQLKIKTEMGEFNTTWNIPEEYATIDVLKYAKDKLTSSVDDNISSDEFKLRFKRILDEYQLYTHYKLLDILRTLIYVINTLTKHNVVWGVGRGSSVSSYILYLIGVHDVDSVLYDLNIKEFIHP